MKKIIFGVAAAALLAAAPVLAAEVKPAIVYGTGGKFDKSFNEAGYNGAEKFKTETGIEFRDFEPQDDTQGEQAIRKFASEGFNPVVALSFAWTDAIGKVSKEFPDTKFVLVDSVVDSPNVRSVVFKEDEGSYLVGLLAGLKSESKKVGFVGGMDIPLIRKFACGYVQGAKAGGATQFFQNMTGTTGAAWNDPVRGGELAKSQIDQGADVVYAAAGATGLGVLQTTADSGKLGIGVPPSDRAYHRASPRISRPSASVLITSTVLPSALRRMSPGLIARPPGMFSAIGTTPTTRIGAPSVASARIAQATAAPPAMSSFMRSMPSAGLIEIPPVSNVMPLPIRPRTGASGAPGGS
jgi:basic membrane protein A